MPFYDHLLRMLVLTPSRVRPNTREICLDSAEAELLRASDFLDAAPGWWTFPPIPPELVRSYGLPGQFARQPPPPAPVAKPPRTPDVGLPCGPGPAPTRYRTPRPLTAETLLGWLRGVSTPDQQRLVLSLARRPADWLPKRELQQRLHRVPAPRFNTALDGLVGRGLVLRDGRRIALRKGVQEVLLEAGLVVNRRTRTHAIADRAVRRHRPLRRMRYVETVDGTSYWQPLFVNGKRTLPPVGTSAWGRSMAAKRGGYARQKQCRALGIHPTAKATAVRLAKRSEPTRRPYRNR